MSALTDGITLVQSEWGWLSVLAFLAYEVLWPTQLWETKFQKTVGRIESKIDDVDEKQLALIQVVRALSREEDGIDDENVDDYLWDNGVEPEHFLVDAQDDTELNQRTSHHSADD